MTQQLKGMTKDGFENWLNKTGGITGLKGQANDPTRGATTTKSVADWVEKHLNDNSETFGGFATLDDLYLFVKTTRPNFENKTLHTFSLDDLIAYAHSMFFNVKVEMD